MGPKKDSKKEPEPPQEEKIPEIPAHELEGYGKFEYLDGAVYEGSWKLCDGVKTKHGQGILRIPGINANVGGEQYEGSWEQDKMCGYGVYTYANGALYRGDWKNNKQQGRGYYEFPDGTCYDGDWENHLMHGTGVYIDGQGRKWQGEFRNGKFESKLQKELAKERQMILRKKLLVTQTMSLIENMLSTLAKSDKKALKENFSPFFAAAREAVKELVKQPYAKFDERPQDKWVQVLGCLKEGRMSPLTDASQATIMSADRILSPQLEGAGQVVEVVSSSNGKEVKGVFVNVQGEAWVLLQIVE